MAAISEVLQGTFVPTDSGISAENPTQRDQIRHSERPTPQRRHNEGVVILQRLMGSRNRRRHLRHFLEFDDRPMLAALQE